MKRRPSRSPSTNFEDKRLPTLFQHLMKTYGTFVPGDLSVRVNFPEHAVEDRMHPEHRAASITLVHEMHHYALMVGTTWGLSYLRYTRSWFNLGVKLLAEEVVPAFRAHGERTPYPLERFCARESDHTLVDHIQTIMKPFSEYAECLLFELGIVPSIKLNGKTIMLPTLKVDDDFSVPFGVWWLIETAARVEDRWRNNDFSERRWPYRLEYDLIWRWTKAIGLSSPLYTLVAIDIALNPVLPYEITEPTSPLSDRLAHMRFELITRLLYEWQEDKSLCAVPVAGADTWFDRGDLDDFFSSLESRVCDVMGWQTAVNAFRYVAERTSGWSEYGIKDELIRAVLARRERHPSIFAFQTLAKPEDDFIVQHPPFFLMFADSARSTITDEKEGTLENLRILRKSVVEQMICEEGQQVYACPFCRREIWSEADHGPCSANRLWPLLWRPNTLAIHDFTPLGNRDDASKPLSST